MQHYAVFTLGLHCLPKYILGVSIINGRVNTTVCLRSNFVELENRLYEANLGLIANTNTLFTQDYNM